MLSLKEQLRRFSLERSLGGLGVPKLARLALGSRDSQVLQIQRAEARPSERGSPRE